MKAVWFILKLGLKILAAPLVLALALFTWVCFGLLYVSSFIFGLASTVVALSWSARWACRWPPPGWWVRCRTCGMRSRTRCTVELEAKNCRE